MDDEVIAAHEAELAFDAHMEGLVKSWTDLGIDPDDFLRCALCREFFIDPDNDFEPREHCQNTTFIVRTASGMDFAHVRPGQGGFAAADAQAQKILGKLYGIDTDGEVIPLRDYDSLGLPPGTMT